MRKKVYPFSLLLLSFLTLTASADPALRPQKGGLFTEDGVRIALNHYVSGRENCIIIAPGTGTTKDMREFTYLIGELLQDYDVIAFDFRGHGESSGRFTFGIDETKDLKTVLEYARPRYKKIGLVGFSIGASTSIVTAGLYKNVDSVVAVSPPMDFGEIENRLYWPEAMAELPENAVNYFGSNTRVRNPLAAGKPRSIDFVGEMSSILFIHGKKDWLIDMRHSIELHKKAGEPKGIILLEGGTHAEHLLDQFPDEMARIIKDWFKKTL
jgi:pimeloyl-ACP methyl ester carboxylesterase